MYKILLHPNSCGCNLLESNYGTVGEAVMAAMVEYGTTDFKIVKEISWKAISTEEEDLHE